MLTAAEVPFMKQQLYLHYNHRKRGKKLKWVKKNSSLFFSLNSLFPLLRQRAIAATLHIILFPLKKSDTESWFHSSQLWYVFSLCWRVGYATLPFFAGIVEVNCGILFKERMNIWELFFCKRLCNWMLNMPSIKLNLSICFLQGIATCPPSGEKFNTRNTVLPLYQYLWISMWLLDTCYAVSSTS